MILITGSVMARSETQAEIRRLSLEHVHRSRAEPGCLSHDVHLDAEIPLRFVFVERWTDEAAIRTHFAVPESRAFARELAKLAAARPTIEIYDATALAL